MATNTTTPFLTVARLWDFCHPAQPKPDAYESHVHLPPNVVYPAGQALGPVIAVPGRWAAPGAGVGPLRRVLRYPCATDANGLVSLGTTVRADDAKFETVPAYFSGPFFIRDLTGLTTDDLMNELGSLIQGVGRTDTAAIIVLRG